MQETKEMQVWSLDQKITGVGYGNPLQYFCLENPMDRGACGLQSVGSYRVGIEVPEATYHSFLPDLIKYQ